MKYLLKIKIAERREELSTDLVNTIKGSHG